MTEYIQIIGKLKQKNNQDFKLMDVADIQVNFDNFNVPCIDAHRTFSQSGIAWDSSENACHVDGDLKVGGGIFQNSDEQLKSNIIRIRKPLRLISKINGVSFDWNRDGRKDYGFIAQEVQKIIPQMVSMNSSTGYRQISYIKLIPFLLEAIKQLDGKVKTLQQKVNKINDMNNNNNKQTKFSHNIMKIFSRFKRLFKHDLDTRKN